MVKAVITAAIALAVVVLNATPVAVEWKAGETAPAKVARPFHGFLPDGRFVVAGGSDFVDGKKVYRSGIYARELDGKWSKVGELPRPVAEGVSCAVEIDKKGFVFCAGGVVGRADPSAPDAAGKGLPALPVADAFLLTIEDGASCVSSLPSLPEPVSMGAAVVDGGKVYVVAAKNVYLLDVKDHPKEDWQLVAEIPGPARSQPVAAIQNGDQKEKMLVVYGGYDAETKQPLHDGYGLVLSQLSQTSQLSQSAAATSTYCSSADSARRGGSTVR